MKRTSTKYYTYSGPWHIWFLVVDDDIIIWSQAYDKTRDVWEPGYQMYNAKYYNFSEFLENRKELILLIKEF